MLAESAGYAKIRKFSLYDSCKGFFQRHWEKAAGFHARARVEAWRFLVKIDKRRCGLANAFPNDGFNLYEDYRAVSLTVSLGWYSERKIKHRGYDG